MCGISSDEAHGFPPDVWYMLEPNMKVTVRFFASHREATGCASYEADVPHGARAADVLSQLCETFPRLQPLAHNAAFAINQTQVAPASPLHDGDELAVLPPMAGG
ncbi:MAG: MoaD/ThiS family protein [Candidatus Eremiobacteraeota bacterium]|nr:MoaD/ThiS family protein [Candidatus Eremiobacteraeota bacterium]